MKNFVRFVSLFVVCLFLLPCSPTKAELAISKQILNFGRCTKDSIPTLKFAIQNFVNESVKVKLIPSQEWIHLSVTSFEGSSQDIEVKIDPANLTFKPDVYLESIKIESEVGNYLLPVRLDLVEKRNKIILTLDNPIALVNDRKIDIGGAGPFIMKGITFVPIRVIIEGFGGKVVPEKIYTKESYNFYIYTFYQDIKIRFLVGVDTALVDKQEEPIDSAPLIRASRAFVPLRTFKQLFNAAITYDSSTRSATIIY